MKKIIFAVAAFISASGWAAEPTIVQTAATAAQIIEASNLAIKSPLKRVVGNSVTFTALVPIKVDPGSIFPNIYTDMTVDMTVVAKDGKFKVESSNPTANGRMCVADAIHESYISACETGMTGMQAHVANNILRQLEKNKQF